MYRKISEPLSVMGSAVIEAVSKQNILQKLEKLTPADRKELGKIMQQYSLGDIQKMTRDASNVTAAKLGAKLIGMLALLMALTAAAGAQPSQVGKAVSDTTKSVDDILAPLLDKADMPSLTMKLAPVQEKLEQEQEKAYHLDTRVGPTETKPAKA